MCLVKIDLLKEGVVHKELGVEVGGAELIESDVDLGKDRAP